MTGTSQATDDMSAAARLRRFSLAADAPMQDVLKLIDGNGEGLALLVDGGGRLQGIITDGDIRRAILAGQRIEGAAEAFAAGIREASALSRLLTAPSSITDQEAVSLMDEHRVRHLPLIGDDGRLEDVALLAELARDRSAGFSAVVMAGGFGTRLQPLTARTPKPLLRVGDKPVIEHILGQLQDAGIDQVNITTHFQAEQIKDRFGDGSDRGLNLTYTQEDEPLGTAGALSMVDPGDQPLLVINGDILTQTDFRAMLNFHNDHDSDITVAVRTYEVSVPFGVIKAEGAKVTRLDEKPALSFFINAGIYLLEPAVVRRIEPGKRMDMTDLISRVIDEGGQVTSFPIHEYWIDIGVIEDYLRAQGDAKSGKLKP